MQTITSQTRLAQTESLGQCWLEVSGKILQEGASARYDGAPIKEIANLTMLIANPDSNDAIIQKYGDPAWLQWMHDNFFTQKLVTELGDAPSYAVRLFNSSDRGLDQIDWVIGRLKNNPESRSAIITTFMPLTDTSYISCISLLDFWIPSDSLELVVYAHSLDFGKKAYGNLVELAGLQSMVADRIGRSVGKLIINAKSVHIYEPEWEFMSGLTSQQQTIRILR